MHQLTHRPLRLAAAGAVTETETVVTFLLPVGAPLTVDAPAPENYQLEPTERPGPEHAPARWAARGQSGSMFWLLRNR